MILFAFFYLCLFAESAIAQIVPDSSLGAESSRLVPDNINNLPSERITGGATRGVNLFHSFREFNIKSGEGAYFENPSGIANIFTRVTGGQPSNILGTLGVQGNANLFLINPRGLIFGPNARLDLRGSFVASTAESIVFNNGFEFSSTTGQTSPLLTVNIPVGLRFRDNPGTIVNQSTATGTVNLPA
ncbi:MAG: filamentous hemagglutinin N-terminal domain-containing protein, partial [Oscillatoriales cyanobacterium]